MFKPPRNPTVGLTPNHNPTTPRAPVAVANSNAPLLLINPRTSGLFRVRLIMASYFGSKSMLRALAEALQRAVPEVRNTRVKADRDGEVVFVGSSRAGTGYNEYAADVVRTIRKDSLGFDSERQVVKSRRRDVAGIAADREERWEDASRGRGLSVCDSCFRRFLRRWGGSSS